MKLQTRHIYLAMAVCVAAAVIALAAGYTWGGTPASWLAFVAVGTAWVAANASSDWRWVDTLAWIAFTAAAAVGLNIQLPAALMLVGAVMALAAWDLGRLSRRLRSIQYAADAQSLTRNHIITLSFTILGASLVTALALTFRADLGFIPIFALAALALLAFNGAIRVLRQR
jgi:hypothetical protein